MAKAWMPIYWGDYLADTHHFTRAEHGGYLLLIAYYWCNGGLPDDDEQVRKIAKCSRRAWPSFKTLMQAFFKSHWKHKRVDLELAKAIEISRVARERAMHRWHCQSQSQSPTEEDKSSSVVTLAAKRGSHLPPDWYPSEADLKFATELGLRMYEIDAEAGKFIDYWRAKAGPNAIKRDWSATWRNWCRRQNEGANGHAKPKQSLVERGHELAKQARELEREAGIGREDEPLGSH